MDRRDFLTGALVASTAAVARPAIAAGSPDTVWTFDNLREVGGQRLGLIGAPRLIDSPWGPATHFDGVRDGLFLDAHPLAGAATFTIEALFRPDGGQFEQRWFHLESNQSPPVPPGKGDTRMLFEIRVVEDRWYLDAFMAGPGYRQAMVSPTKTYPVGRWYRVAQTYDGRTYRSFVDGELQMETSPVFTPQGPGRASVGVRLNQVAFFHGAVRQARFAHYPLPQRTRR